MPRYGKPAIASWGPDRLDVFFKSRQGSLIHAWIDRGADGSHDLGGSLDSDPAAVSRAPGRLDVFARSTGESLLHTWRWVPELGRMSDEPVTLPGGVGVAGRTDAHIGTDPVPVALDADRLMVFARSVDDPLVYWESTRAADGGNSWSTPKQWGGGVEKFDPAVVRNAPGFVGILTRNANGQLVYWELRQGQFRPAVNLGGQIASQPVVMSWAPVRTDVYARDNTGALRHWGRGFLPSGFPSRWFENELTPGLPQPFDADPTLAPRAEDEADMFVRTAAGSVRHWRWDARERVWAGGGAIMEGANSPVAAVWRSPTRLDVIAQADSKTLLHWSEDNGARSFRRWEIEAGRPSPAPQDAVFGQDTAINPGFLIVRPADHALLGVTAQGYRVAGGNPARFEMDGSGSRLALTFPPQHLAEEVSRPGESPPTSSSGVPIWRARLSGPSRLAFSTSPQTFDATAAGVLAALRGAAVSANDTATGVELPFGLMTTPAVDTGVDTSPVGSAVARHPAIPVEGETGTGLWRTRLGNSGGDGGLRLSSPKRMRFDPFPLALTRANRSQIQLQDSPAKAERMELSSLGGSLVASGKWPTFEWDHKAFVGRDQYVRTATKGVLYPFGHRAVFVEVSERSGDETVAALRKQRTIYITEPRRSRQSRAFPFRSIEFRALEYSSLDDPVWGRVSVPLRSLQELEGNLDRLLDRLSGLYLDLRPSFGFYQPGTPVIEALVMGQAWEYLKLYAAAQGIRKQIALIKEGSLGEDQVEVFFMPRVGGRPLPFPVRAAASDRDLHFSLPLIFVADIQTAASAHVSFVSLTDPRVEDGVRNAYRAEEAGIVRLDGAPFNISPAGDGSVAPSDVQEVHRINIAGHGAAGTFEATLGGRNAEEWAAEIGVPTMRSLLGGDPRTNVRFDLDYLSGAANDVALRVVGQGGPDAPEFLSLDFSGKSDRSGGLISPNSVADGISRMKGLVNVEALATRSGVGNLDPAKLFSDGASLFGFPLWELVKDIKVPPEVVTVLTEGKPPTVRMTWEDIALKESAGGAFAPREPENGIPSRLTLTVVSSPDLNETVCTLTNFMLVMPPGPDHLIEIVFDKVEFRQNTGQAPRLSMSGLNAKLTGKLRLLQVLQEKVGLGGLGPKIEPGPTDIVARFAVPVPDAAAFAFVMSNLTFSAYLRVPFNGEPVALGLGFASREKPFTLTVLAFGGGGYVDLELIHTGLRRLEVSLQFGAALAINIGIGQAEVHAFGGIRFQLMPGGGAVLTGFIHIGGSVSILGLISVSVELRVELEYRFESNALVGRAKLVIEIDITLFSESVEIDSGEWVISGGSDARRLASPTGARIDAERRARDERRAVDDWRAYRRSFA